MLVSTGRTECRAQSQHPFLFTAYKRKSQVPISPVLGSARAFVPDGSPLVVMVPS